MKVPRAGAGFLSLNLLSRLASAAWNAPAEYKVTASADGHFLQDSTGAPFFWQGDTAWLLFARLNREEAEKYFSDRAAKGFNMILAVGLTQAGIATPNRYGDVSFIDRDPTKPNEPYWKYVDELVELAWSKGIRIAMVPAWGSFTHSSSNQTSYLDQKTSRPFGEFIGSRYPYLPKLLVADTNPWWTNKSQVSSEYAQGGVPSEYKFTDWGPGFYDELAEGIVTGERATLKNPSWQPLMTIHPTNQWFSGGPVAVASAFMGDREWLTLDSSQSGHADYPPNPPIPWWNARRGYESVEYQWAIGETKPGKKRPAVDNEPHYENRYNNGKPQFAAWNASDVRVGSWQAAFSGGAGITYGSDMIMQMAIPGIYASDGTGPGQSWEEELKLAGSGQMQFIQKAILDRGNSTYFQRMPAQNIIVGSAGANDKRVTATRDSKGKWLMVYAPAGQPFSVDLKDLRACKRSPKASWYDPLSGSYTKFDFTRPANGTVATFTPPIATNHADWLLVIES